MIIDSCEVILKIDSLKGEIIKREIGAKNIIWRRLLSATIYLPDI